MEESLGTVVIVVKTLTYAIGETCPLSINVVIGKLGLPASPAADKEALLTRTLLLRPSNGLVEAQINENLNLTLYGKQRKH